MNLQYNFKKAVHCLSSNKFQIEKILKVLKTGNKNDYKIHRETWEFWIFLNIRLCFY